MVNKGSHVADFVRFRPHTYTLYAHSTISAALMAAINFRKKKIKLSTNEQEESFLKYENLLYLQRKI